MAELREQRSSDNLQEFHDDLKRQSYPMTSLCIVVASAISLLWIFADFFLMRTSWMSLMPLRILATVTGVGALIYLRIGDNRKEIFAVWLLFNSLLTAICAFVMPFSGEHLLFYAMAFGLTMLGTIAIVWPPRFYFCYSVIGLFSLGITYLIIPSSIPSYDKVFMILFYVGVVLCIGVTYAHIRYAAAWKEYILRRDLSKAIETKDRFLGILAHDLRTPIGNLSVILNDLVKENDPIGPDLLRILRNSSKQTHQLLENLLVWSQSQGNELEHDPVDIALSGLVRDNVDLFTAAAKKKQILLESDVEKDHWVLADENMLSTVIRNLINNAIKFTPSGGRVKVSSLKTDQKIRIEVRDTGIGMSRETLDSLFRAERTKSTLGTEDELGSGLGLAICAEFASANDGQIGCDSEIGKGSTFWLVLNEGSSERASAQKAAYEKSVFPGADGFFRSAG